MPDSPTTGPRPIRRALLSVNAGVVEELLFRLAMPVLLYGAFDPSGSITLDKLLSKLPVQA